MVSSKFRTILSFLWKTRYGNYDGFLTISQTFFLVQVYAGDDDGTSCETDGVEYVEGPIGSAATFCFLITNSGNTYLKNLRVKNPALNFDETLTRNSPLAPGASVTVNVARPIMGRVQNQVTVSAEPSTNTGEDLPYQDVSDTDPSEVAFLALTPGLEVSNTVSVPETDWYHPASPSFYGRSMWGMTTVTNAEPTYQQTQSKIFS